MIPQWYPHVFLTSIPGLRRQVAKVNLEAQLLRGMWALGWNMGDVLKDIRFNDT